MARTGIKRRALGEIPVNTPPRRTQNAKKGLRVARGAAKKVLAEKCSTIGILEVLDASPAHENDVQQQRADDHTTINNTNIYDAGFVENFNVSDPVKHVAIITQEEPNIQETPSSTEELGSNSTTNDHIINENHNGTKAIAFGFLCVFVAITVMATKIQNDEYWYLNAHSVKMDTTNYPSSKTVDPEQFPLSHSSMSMLQNMGAANAFDQAVPNDDVHTADQILDSDQPLTSDFSMSSSSAELLEQMSKETAFDNDAHDAHDAPEPVKDDAGVVPDVIESGFALSESSTRLLQQTHDNFETDAHADEERAPFTEYEEIVDVYSFDTPVRRKSSGKNAQAQEHANFDFADAKPSNSELSAAQDYSSYSHINQPAAESKTELLDTECHRSENPLIIESTIQQMIDYPTQKVFASDASFPYAPSPLWSGTTGQKMLKTFRTESRSRFLRSAPSALSRHIEATALGAKYNTRSAGIVRPSPQLLPLHRGLNTPPPTTRHAETTRMSRPRRLREHMRDVFESQHPNQVAARQALLDAEKAYHN